MRKVLVLTKYGRLGASSRMRLFQYLPFLEERGFQIKVASLFSDRTIRKLYGQSRTVNAFRLLDIIRRFAVLLIRDRCDLIWIEKELFPYLPSWAERWLSRGSAAMVADYDDAVFHCYDHHSNALIRRLLSGKIAKVMSLVDLVIAGNDYLRNYAVSAGASRVEVLPTVVDLARYTPRAFGVSSTFSVGWIGTPLNARYLKPIMSALSVFCGEAKAKLVLVGAGPQPGLSINHRVEQWSEDGEVSLIKGFDVGIMPLPDEPFERGKCGYKLIQCMACGVPVVASPIGANSTIVREGVDGFLARTPDQWLSALRQMYLNPTLRASMSTAGRRRIEEHYALQVTAPRLGRLLTEVLESKTKSLSC